MANPQPEPFVKFSKELFDALLLSSMPAGHKEIVLGIIRRTYGEYGKKVAPVSYSLLRRITGRADSGIRRTVAALESHGVLVKIAEPTFRTPALWKLNKDYETWGAWSVRSATIVAERTDEAEGTKQAERTDKAERTDEAEGTKQAERKSERTATPVAERSATTVAERTATPVAPLKNIEHRTGRGARAREDDFAGVDFGEYDPQGSPEEENLLSIALGELPDTESGAADIRKVIRRHLDRRLLPRQVEAVLYELADWWPKNYAKGKKPRTHIHLTLQQWLMRLKPEEPSPEEDGPSYPRIEVPDYWDVGGPT